MRNGSHHFVLPPFSRPLSKANGFFKSLHKSHFKAPKFSLQSYSAFSFSSTHRNMTSIASSFLLLLSSLVLLSIARGQDRAPHGIAQENPMAFSPSAYDFFHPKTQDLGVNHPCVGTSTSSCSPLLVAADVGANQAIESKVMARQHAGSNRVGAGGVAAIVFGCTFAVLLAMGVYYAAIARQAIPNRSEPVQPEA